MLQIGMKYCGGCQEHHDRIDIARQIQYACREFAVCTPANPGTLYDLLLVNCGCTVICPDLQGYHAKHGQIIVCGPEDLEHTIETIQQLYAQEDNP